MKKEEIIKNIISNEIELPNSIYKIDNRISTAEYNLSYKKHVLVDIDKLASFLAKYVVKEDLIID